MGAKLESGLDKASMRRLVHVKSYFIHRRTDFPFADQREAPRWSPDVAFLFLERFFFLPAESPCFHSHSEWSYLLRCQLAFSIDNGRCHLELELCPGFRALVLPCPRSRPNPAWISNPIPLTGGSPRPPGLGLVQRFVYLTADPQPVQQNGQFPSHRYHRPFLAGFAA